MGRKRPAQINENEQLILIQSVGEVFTPTSPISDIDLFSGRLGQLRRVFEAINERGKHVVLFGERGVGKTSLANILSERLQYPGGSMLFKRVNCSTTDTYLQMWRRFLRFVPLTVERDKPGIRPVIIEEQASAASLIEEDAGPGEICQILSSIGQQVHLVPIFDEFDRLEYDETRRLMADTIKTLSDQPTQTTIVIVGVADSVDELIEQHESIERALAQIPMPRMSQRELEEIFENATQQLDMVLIRLKHLTRERPGSRTLPGRPILPSSCAAA